MKKIKAGLIGCGTVGHGVLKMLKRNRSYLTRKIGCPVEIKFVCDSSASVRKQAKALGYSVTGNVQRVLNDSDIQIVIELIGGSTVAYQVILGALKNSKHVVTANKAVLAEHWNEIFSLAHEKKCLVYMEASVGAGIPIIQALNEGFAGNRINEIVGILNGTTNFILTKMYQTGMNFQKALKLAQECGFAESNPVMDIDGFDSQQKLAILASIVFGTAVRPELIHCEGINGIDISDLIYGNEFGYVMKLLAIMRQSKDGVELRVHPSFISRFHPLATVEDEYNGIYVIGDAVGETMFYGKGAGQMPAASAVVSDLVYVAQKIHYGIGGRLPYVMLDSHKKIKLKNIADLVTQYYLRFMTVDQTGVLAQISNVLGRHNVSIASVVQKESYNPKRVPIVMVTHDAREKDIMAACKEIDALKIVQAPTRLIRIT